MNTDPDTDVIDNESAVIAEAAAEAEAAKAAAAAPVVETPTTPEPVVEATPDPIAAAIAENAAATRALAEKLAAQAAPVVETPAVVETPRDFDAELQAAEAKFTDLEAKYEEGEIDAEAFKTAKAEFRNAERTLTREQARADAEAAAKAALQQTAEQTAAQAKAADEAAWKSASDAFQADPGNAKLLADEIQRGAFQAAINVVARENPGIAYPDLLVKAREKVTGVAAIDPDKATRDATFARAQETRTTAPTTLRDVPNSGDADNAPGSALDNLGISELEDALFRMSDADRNRYLADAPGGLRDNPRYTG